MIIGNRFYELTLDDDGALRRFRAVSGRPLLYEGEKPLPLFAVKLLDEAGAGEVLTSAGLFSGCREEGDRTVLSFESKRLGAEVTVRHPADEPFVYFSLRLANRTGKYLEWIDFPGVLLPNDLPGAGGTSRLFWPAMEGCLIEDITLRERTYLRYSDKGYPSKGWEGMYPGPCPMQFSAYYGEDGQGLYLASHDAACNVKAIEYAPAEEGRAIRLENKLFVGERDTTDYAYEYEIVLGVFRGDWYDAADIYRSWLLSTDIVRLPRFEDNDRIPAWVKESPVVAVYPVRGVKDTGDMSPNCYYPYTEGLPYLEQLSSDFDSKMMALLCHWEGTAPWAPPYVWPPYGDKADFDEFIRRLHERGHLFGLYCSGIQWTEKSTLCPEYNMEEFSRANGMKELMCCAPDQSLPYSLICGGPIRTGYDMCPAPERTKEIAVEEIRKILDGCDVDYLQFFDQNVGGTSYLCYSDRHGHPRGPGKWMWKEMREIYRRARELLRERGLEGKVLIGCEAAAAEPYVNDLLFNDVRYVIDFMVGNPVPAYNYVFHEYVNNFMGNQNTSYHIVDLERSPENIFYRFAYSFLQGDVLTVVLGRDGAVHWDWCTPWDGVPAVDQATIRPFIRLLNAWRKTAARDFLLFGRMEKPLAVRCAKREEPIQYGGAHRYDCVLTTRFSYRRRDAQRFVNYLAEEQTVAVETAGRESLRLVRNPAGEAEAVRAENGLLTLTLAPYSAALLDLAPERADEI